MLKSGQNIRKAHVAAKLAWQLILVVAAFVVVLCCTVISNFHECTRVEYSPGVWGARPLMSDTLDSEC